MRRIVGAGGLWVTEFILAYDGQPSYSVSVMEFVDGKVARETQYFADPFEPGPSRANGLSEWDEIGATRALRRLERAELPVDSAELARFLIGKMLVRTLAEGVAGGHRRDRGRRRRPREVTPIAASPRAIARFSSSAGMHISISLTASRSC